MAKYSVARDGSGEIEFEGDLMDVVDGQLRIRKVAPYNPQTLNSQVGFGVNYETIAFFAPGQWAFARKA